MFKLFSVNLCFLPLSFSLLSQNEPVYLDSIVGTVYEIRNDMHGYVDNIEDFPVNDIIYPNDIHYPETRMIYGFDGIFPNDSFAIIFTGLIVTEKEGTYELSVTSDDGTRLWLNGEEIINNDGSHPMRKKSDTLFLAAAKTPFRLWYYQDNMDKMGLLFDQKLLAEGPEPEEIISFDSDLLFNVGEYQLQNEAFKAIDDFISTIINKSNIKLVIEGHTDSTGSEKFNQALSLKRAQSVQTYLEANLPDSEIQIEAKGYGFSRPKVQEHTDDDRRINRRVEILIFNLTD